VISVLPRLHVECAIPLCCWKVLDWCLECVCYIALLFSKGRCDADCVGNQVYGFGSGKRGQLGVSNDKVKSVNVPRAVTGFDGVEIIGIAANGDHSAALSGNTTTFPFMISVALNCSLKLFYNIFSWWARLYLGKRLQGLWRCSRSSLLKLFIEFYQSSSWMEPCFSYDWYFLTLN